MLQIKVPLTLEEWDEENEVFIEPVFQTLQLEHSLASISKWESKWCKPFLGQREKTDEEVMDYIKCMTITQDVHPGVYDYLTSDNARQINEYIEHSMTATTFSNIEPKKFNREIITSEVIYEWMIALGIPFECEDWHINRLITLIKVRSIKSQPPTKRNTQQTADYYSELNAARMKKLNTKG